MSRSSKSPKRWARATHVVALWLAGMAGVALAIVAVSADCGHGHVTLFGFFVACVLSFYFGAVVALAWDER